jgi:N-methylhydantoinase A/oxoprolinase/acetone carboxylase beta subunit
VGETRGGTPREAWVAAAGTPATPAGSREIYLAATGEMTVVPVYRAEALEVGDALVGPAVITGDTTTILVGPGDELSCAPDAFRMRCGSPERPQSPDTVSVASA